MFKKKHSAPKKGIGILPIVAIVFIVIGAFFLGKLAKYQFNIGPISSEVIYPLSFIEWIAAIGCIFGGLYILYRSLFKKAVLFKY
jgi:hypothetical protein